MLIISVIIAAIAYIPCLVPSPLVTISHPDRLVGTIYYRGGTWPIHVDIGQAEDNVAVLTFPALGVAGIEVPMDVDEDVLTLDIPYGIGQQRLHWGNGAYRTDEQRDAGGAIALVLKADPVERPRTTRITFQSNDVSLAGTMWIPSEVDDQRLPLVVVGHGASPFSREMPEYRFWAEYLTRQGYAVFLYDKRGVGESEGNYEGALLSDLADDLIEAVKASSTHENVDRHRIALLGGSQFGWLAFRAARELELRAMVLTAPPAVDPVTLEIQVLADQLRTLDLTRDEYADAVAYVRAYFAASRHPELFDSLNTIRKKQEAENWSEHVPVAEQVSDLAWWGLHATFDPTADIEYCDCPVFIAYGRNDKIATPEINALRFENLLLTSPAPLELWIANDANHRLEVPGKMINGKFRFPQLAPGLLERVDAFLEEHLLP